jgi:hypothetical protein
MQLHELAPWRDPVLAAEAEAPVMVRAGFQSGPAPYCGVDAVGADNPTRAELIERDTRAPHQPDAFCGSVLDQ